MFPDHPQGGHRPGRVLNSLPTYVDGLHTQGYWIKASPRALQRSCTRCESPTLQTPLPLVIPVGSLSGGHP